MRGRYPSGPEFVEQLSGSAVAKQRARVLLETITGQRRVQEACAVLGISEPRFDQLRIHGLGQLVQSFEPRLAGRPPKTPTPAEERIRALETEVASLRMQVKIAQARAEVALVLPNAVAKDVADHDQSQDASEKKTAPPKRPAKQQQRRPRTRAPATRKST